MRDEYLKAIALAAAPTFAIMALLTGIFGGAPHDVVCSAAQGASPVGGMVWMYTLMSAFHSAPWLKLISGGEAVPAAPPAAACVAPKTPDEQCEGENDEKPS